MVVRELTVLRAELQNTLFKLMEAVRLYVHQDIFIILHQANANYAQQNME